MESRGFYNELMAFCSLVADEQREVNGEATVWTDPEIQKALAETDPTDPKYLGWYIGSETKLDAAYTAAMDRMYAMLKAAVRRGLAENGNDTAEDARDALRSRID